MLDFMDLIQSAFLSATSWPSHNSYSTLTSTSRALLDFPTPLGLTLSLSSLSTPHYATSYRLSSSGPLTGSLSYLYTTPSVSLPASKDEDLIPRFAGYQHLHPLPRIDAPSAWEIWHSGRRIDRRDVLMYGRLFLPGGRLNALYMRRTSPSMMVRLAAVSESPAPVKEDLKGGGGNQVGGCIIASVMKDTGKYSAEGLYSTAGGLVGLKGLWNFGFDPRVHGRELEGTSRVSVGGEIYYGVLNKSGGVSTGIRYATLPGHPGNPLTLTLTVNPLMGHLSATYATQATDTVSLAARYDFNTFSYESDVVLGCELWRPKSTKVDSEGEQNFEGVMKANWRQSTGVFGLLWEGRVKSLLFSIGSNIDLAHGGEKPLFRTLGIEVAYSS